MMPTVSLLCRPLGLLAGLLLAAALPTLRAQPAAEALIPNSGMETDADGDGWPDGWPRVKEGGSWENEGGNRFLRLASPAPGRMVMLYREIRIPEGVEALELSWKQRVTGLKVGAKPWFDARIMMEFMDADRGKVEPGPPVPYYRKDSPGWEPKIGRFLVPEGARFLKFMPALFNVAAGAYDLDDISLVAIDPAPLRAAGQEAQAAREQKLAEETAARQSKASATLAAGGSLIPNGDFEAGRSGGWPGSTDLQTEDGNAFARLRSTQPGKMVMLYRQLDLPAGVKALKLSWRWRVSDLQIGEKPWFDARWLLEFHDAAGKKLPGGPGPAYSRGTKGWESREMDFLVPEGAARLVLMPALFNVKAGVMDLDDIRLVPTGTAALEAAARLRHVAPEEPQKEKWPAELRVQGNRLVDPSGREVWLQGLNAGNLETLPHDKQVIKSAVVAVDEWKANAVRLPVKDEFWFGRSPYQKDGGKEYRETVDRIVTLVANRGAWLILDLHRYRAPKAEYAEFWKDAAARYKNHPAVIFDLMNEPHGTSWEVWRNGGWVGEKSSGVDESAFLTEEEKKKNQGFESVGMQGLLDAVRSTGARNIVAVGGLGWAGDLSGAVNGYALDEREGGNGIMYSWHQYNWHKGWDKTVLPVAAKHPVLVGEVGADVKKMDFIPHDIQESPYTWVPDMLGFIQKHRLNWTAWCFHPKATPVLISDWKYTPTPFWGVFAKEALSGKQFEMKRMR